MTISPVLQALRSTPNAFIADGYLEADNLYSANDEFLEQLQALETDAERGARCQSVFELGVLIWLQAQRSGVLPDLEAEVDRLEESVSRATAEAVKAVELEARRLSAPEDGVLATAVDRELAKLRASIDQAFDEDDRTSALARIEASVTEATQKITHENQAALARMLDSNGAESPLARLRAEIAKDVNTPLKEFSDTLVEVRHFIEMHGALNDRTPGPAEGLDFEDLVGGALATIANRHG